jgi:hypothetical protein
MLFNNWKVLDGISKLTRHKMLRLHGVLNPAAGDIILMTSEGIPARLPNIHPSEKYQVVLVAFCSI